VLEDEATEDIYRLGGVPGEQPYDAPIFASLRTRLPWLLLNMGTALVSGLVLGLFKSTIAQVAALTVFFPLVAGVCGSAGTQALTVTVRGLAIGELEPRDGLRALGRELLIGSANGLVVGLLVAGIALALGEYPMLGLVVGWARASLGLWFPSGCTWCGSIRLWPRPSSSPRSPIRWATCSTWAWPHCS
jgi:magnesium transporter